MLMCWGFAGKLITSVRLSHGLQCAMLIHCSRACCVQGVLAILQRRIGVGRC